MEIWKIDTRKGIALFMVCLRGQRVVLGVSNVLGRHED